MSLDRIKEDLHDIKTHRDSWSKLVSEAALLAKTPDEAYALRATAVEIERRSDDFSGLLREGASEDDLLASADHFLLLVPRIRSALILLRSPSDILEEDASYLLNEENALDHLIAERSGITEEVPSP